MAPASFASSAAYIQLVCRSVRPSCRYHSGNLHGADAVCTDLYARHDVTDECRCHNLDFFNNGILSVEVATPVEAVIVTLSLWREESLDA
eukprot:scaffold70569_cov17-Prasinocladus_malaysianus.AAC.1